jgi:hypothetical protein
MAGDAPLELTYSEREVLGALFDVLGSHCWRVARGTPGYNGSRAADGTSVGGTGMAMQRLVRPARTRRPVGTRVSLCRTCQWSRHPPLNIYSIVRNKT